MENIVMEPTKKDRSRGGRESPLGLFDKFKVKVPFDTLTEDDLDEDPDVEFVKVLSPPIHDWQNKGPVDKKIQKRNEQSCRLLGSWNPGSKELLILSELENSPDHDQIHEVERIIIQDDDDNDMQYESDRGLPQAPATSDDDNDDINDMLCEYDRGFSQTIPVKSQMQPSDQQDLKLNTRKKLPRKKVRENMKALASLILGSKRSKDIRTTTMLSFYNSFVNRIQEIQNIDVHLNLKHLAKEIECAIYNLYKETGVKYKKKYRSLLFNLKDPKNQLLFRHVVLGEITPQCLVLLSSTEMASQELTDWRNHERQHTLELIEKAEKDHHSKSRMTKLTHKGLIEIHTTPDQMLTLEDLSKSPWCDQGYTRSSSKKKNDTTSQHKSHLLDVDCRICMGVSLPSDETGLDQRTKSQSQVNITDSIPVTNIFSSTEEMNMRQNSDAEIEGMPPSSEVVWKGFIQMYSIKQFKVTAIKVSGYNTHLCRELPKVITSKGFITEDSVWDFIKLIWPQCTKDMCLLRFCPQTSCDAVSFNRLYSYLNRKLKYGIIKTDKMEAFVLPLPACQPIPSQLHPQGGPGIEDNHPHLLLCLLLPKHPSWTCPKTVNRKQKELDVPDDIFSSIIQDVEREEHEMAEQGFPPIWPPVQQSTVFGNEGGQDLLGSLCQLANTLHKMSTQDTNVPYMPTAANTLDEISMQDTNFHYMPTVANSRDDVATQNTNFPYMPTAANTLDDVATQNTDFPYMPTAANTLDEVATQNTNFHYMPTVANTVDEVATQNTNFHYMPTLANALFDMTTQNTNFNYMPTLANALFEMTTQNTNFNYMPTTYQPDPTGATIWPDQNMTPNFQSTGSYESQAMFQLSFMFGDNFPPSQF